MTCRKKHMPEDFCPGRRRESILPIVFGLLGRSLSLHHPEDFFLCLPVGHSLRMKVKDQLIHERIHFGELRCVHS